MDNTYELSTFLSESMASVSMTNQMMTSTRLSLGKVNHAYSPLALRKINQQLCELLDQDSPQNEFSEKKLEEIGKQVEWAKVEEEVFHNSSWLTQDQLPAFLPETGAQI